MNATADRQKVRTMLVRMLGGAAVGAAGTGLFIALVGEPHMDMENPGVLLAIVTGLSYVLIGLIVAVGLASPQAGAKFLNVEDADEIREEGPKLWMSALCCILIGAFLLLLAMSGGLLDGGTALMLAASCLAGMVVLAVLSAKHYDELTRQLSLESAAWAYYASLILIGGWAALAHLGYASWLSPLAFVSALALLLIVSIFVVAAKRGLLTR